MGIEANYAFYYIESNLFCICIYGILLYKTLTAIDRQHKQVIFAYMLVSHMAYFLTDVFWVLVDSGALSKTAGTIYLSNIVNYSAASVIGYVTFLYMQLYQDIMWFANRRNQLIAAIPALFNILMVVLSPVTGLYFSVNEAPELVNGPLYPVMLLITFGYMVVAAVRAWYLAQRPENYATRRIHLTIVVFPILPLVAGVLQALNWRVPWICYGLTIAVLFMYITFSDDQISLDSLTGLNNRNELTRYLSHRMRNPHPGLDLYLMLIDADHFKSINDTYGHNEGDTALRLVADGLREACADRRYHEFVSRYAGDEFVICVEASDELIVRGVMNAVVASVADVGRAAGRPYALSVTAGYARYVPGTETGTIPGLIATADSELYRRKRRRR